jgi:hypothetical protein
MKPKRVAWVDSKREPKCPSNPAYPDGVDLDATAGQTPSCYVELPYPARRCGYFLVCCDDCHQSVVLTTAGRRDDPRSVKLLCIRRPN